MANHTIVGIDVSKGVLDAHRLPDGASASFANDADGIARLDRWMGGEVERVAFEPTGRFHRALEEALLASGRPAAKVNPLQARRFAEADGQWAKTDALDARGLARFAQRMEPRRLRAPSAAQRQLRELRSARSFAVRQRAAAEQSDAWSHDEGLRQMREQAVSLLREQEARIDGRIAETVAADATLRQRAEWIASIPGFGATAAAGLLAEMPELGTLTGREAASLAGLAPTARESGTWRGQRSIRGGRAAVRELLYMPAVAACRWNPDMKALHDRLKARGKQGRVALVAVMRRLLVLANALVRDRRKWSAEPPGADEADETEPTQETAEAGPGPESDDAPPRPDPPNRSAARADAGSLPPRVPRPPEARRGGSPATAAGSPDPDAVARAETPQSSAT